MQIVSVMIISFNRPQNDQGGADPSGHGSSAPHGCHGAHTSKGTPWLDAAPPERIWACGHGTIASHRSAGSDTNAIDCANAINCTSHANKNQSRAWGPLPGAADLEAQSGRGRGVVHLPVPIVRRPPHHHNQCLQSLYQQASGAGASVHGLFVVIVQSRHTEVPHA